MTAPSPKPSPAAPAPPPIAGAAAAAAFPPGGADLPLPMAREVSSSAPGGRAAGRFPSTPMLLLCLAALTGLAAFLRYWRISYQGYWTDEGYTIERIRGTFDYLLTRLTDQGFPPGWYVLLRGWCLGVEKLTGDGAFAFSPASTRGLTALFGTLTVPAMYFLARQFTDRRGALLVTLLAAVNPFLIYYSRDIKMYPATWFFVVLNAGLFFKWQTTHRHWLWFVPFLVSGACMTALHSAPWFLIGLQLIWMLTRPRLRALDGPLWLTAVGLISLFPYWWFKIYLSPDRWLLRITTDANAGMGWLQRYTDMSWTTITSLSTSHLLGYLWPVYPPDNRISNWFELGPDFLQHLATRSSERMATWERDVGVAFFSILVLGLLPWRRVFRRRSAPPPAVSAERAASATRGRAWWVGLWIVLPIVVLAATWIPTDSPWYARVWMGFNPKPIWEPRYLGVIVPAWLLWMGAALRRFPTWPVRAALTLFVVAACTASSLSNHLIYRNAPYQHAADIAARYVGREDRGSKAVCVPAAPYSEVAEDAAYRVAYHIRPGGPDDGTRGAYVWTDLNDEAAVAAWLRGTAGRPAITTVVLTDRYGDRTAVEDPLSDAATNALLGDGWTRVYEESYRWHYEWRFYIFHTWRTRVWQRVPPP